MATPLGEQIAAMRAARRMTQHDLAEAADLSLSAVRKYEQGQRVPSAPILQALSKALGVTIERLADPGRPASRVHMAMPGLREVLATYDSPEDGPTRSRPVLEADVTRAIIDRLGSHYNELIDYLPDLLAELGRAFHSANGHEKEEVARLLTMAYRSADAIAYKYGYYDLSSRIIQLMAWSTQHSDDELLDSSVTYVRTEEFFVTQKYDTSIKKLEQSISKISSQTTLAGLATQGSLHMRASVVAARMHRPDLARAHINEARLLAQHVPDGVYVGTAFGPSSVRIHDASLAVELGEASLAILAAREWNPPASIPAERRSHYYVDVAQAQLWRGHRQAAFTSLVIARRIAPQHVREHPRVRTTLQTLLRLHRVPPEPLVRYAEWSRVV